MTIGQRIRILRKELNLTQVEFGERIGLKQAVIGQMENNTRNITDRTIASICEKFNVRKEWLCEGSGNIFIETESSLISQLVNEFNLDILDRKIIECYLRLAPSQRMAVKEYVNSLISAVNGEVQKQNDIEREVESYRQELELEKKVKTSSVLPDTKDA